MRRIEEDRRQAARQVDLEEVARAVAELAARRPEIEAVWLFGSYAHGTARRTSDVDLAVMTAPELARDPGHRFELQEILESLLGVPVDVVLLSPHLPYPLLWEILRAPRLLFALDPEDAGAFASGLRGLVREDWPRFERRWERARQWAEEQRRA